MAEQQPVEGWPFAEAARGDYTFFNPWKGGLIIANGLFRGLLAGALVGATAALLLAPKKGDETRKALKEKGNEYIEAVREKVRRNGGSGTS